MIFMLESSNPNDLRDHAVRVSDLPPRVQDIRGLRFGRLVVRSYVRPYEVREKSKWLCRCDCGNETIAKVDQLRRGRTKSCGCWRVEATGDRFRTGVNGLQAQHPIEYTCRMNLIDRCQNPHHRDFKSYGGRGIVVCERWLTGDGKKSGFDCFFEDMGPRPGPGLSIDRVDNNGNYEPKNCRWATAAQQMSNRRRK
jgi:hypothetical protein